MRAALVVAVSALTAVKAHQQDLTGPKYCSDAKTETVYVYETPAASKAVSFGYPVETPKGSNGDKYPSYPAETPNAQVPSAGYPAYPANTPIASSKGPGYPAYPVNTPVASSKGSKNPAYPVNSSKVPSYPASSKAEETPCSTDVTAASSSIPVQPYSAASSPPSHTVSSAAASETPCSTDSVKPYSAASTPVAVSSASVKPYSAASTPVAVSSTPASETPCTSDSYSASATSIYSMVSSIIYSESSMVSASASASASASSSVIVVSSSVPSSSQASSSQVVSSSVVSSSVPSSSLVSSSQAVSSGVVSSTPAFSSTQMSSSYAASSTAMPSSSKAAISSAQPSSSSVIVVTPTPSAVSSAIVTPTPSPSAQCPPFNGNFITNPSFEINGSEGWNANRGTGLAAAVVVDAGKNVYQGKVAAAGSPTFTLMQGSVIIPSGTTVECSMLAKSFSAGNVAFNVLLDGQVCGSSTPTNNGWAEIDSKAITLFGDHHTLFISIAGKTVGAGPVFEIDDVKIHPTAGPGLKGPNGDGTC